MTELQHYEGGRFVLITFLELYGAGFWKSAPFSTDGGALMLVEIAGRIQLWSNKYISE